MQFKISSGKLQLFSYFIIISLTGAILLQHPLAYVNKNPAPFIDTLFVSVSAVCVTGLSTINMDQFSQIGFIILMCLIELGGLGILSFISIYLLMPSKKVSLVNRKFVRDFFIDEVEINPRKILFDIILFMTIIQIIGGIGIFISLSYYKTDNALFTSIFLAISAFCNAGFTPYNDNLASFRDSITINFFIMFLITMGGLGFIVLQNIFQSIIYKKQRLTLHTKIVLGMSFLLILSGALIIFFSNNSDFFKSLSLKEKILGALFQSVTTRTAGFETIAQAEFSPLTKIISMLLMFIGGSPGSIAGGIKTTTFFILLVYVIKENSSAKGIVIFNRRINYETTEKALNILCKSLTIICISIFCISITEEKLLASGLFNISDLFYEVISAFGTVGLSQNLSPHLSKAGKIVIILTMFVGRTGIFAMSLKVLSGEKERFIEYPHENILVG